MTSLQMGHLNKSLEMSPEKYCQQKEQRGLSMDVWGWSRSPSRLEKLELCEEEATRYRGHRSGVWRVGGRKVGVDGGR